MSRKQSSFSRLIVAAVLAVGASGVAVADDSSMSRFGGDSYAYFNRPAIGNAAASAAWRQTHPNGPTERELQALSSSDLSTFASQSNPPVFASAPADPTWRASHPNGFTERELQALSSSSLALWQAPAGTVAAADQSNVAQVSKGTLSTQLKNLFRPADGEGATQ
jgi:hypothetical protein